MAADWITTTEAKKISGYHPVYLRQLIRSGKIKAKKWGRDWQVSNSSLLAYIKAAEESGDKRKGAKEKILTSEKTSL